ncbi:MAG: hypothetical protein WCG25_08165 [bacterium]
MIFGKFQAIPAPDTIQSTPALHAANTCSSKDSRAKRKFIKTNHFPFASFLALVTSSLIHSN